MLARSAIRGLCLALSLLPTLALAQQPTAPQMVLIPRDVAQAALTWISAPDATLAVKLYAALAACIADNPDSNGRVVHQGQDQCASVSEALAARDAEIGALRKQIEDAKPKAPEGVPK